MSTCHLLPFLDGADILPMDIVFDRSSGASTGIGVWKSGTRKGRQLVDGKKIYKIVDGFLEARIPLSLVKKYLANEPRMTEFCIANADAKGKWIKDWTSRKVLVDYGK